MTHPAEKHSTRPAALPAALVAFAITLVLYLTTMNRTIGFIDRGELAAAAATLGIPHPTGYPVFIALGWLVTRLVPLRPVLALNVFAAILVAAGVAALVFLYDRILRLVSRGDRGARPRAALALLGALFTGLSITWWQQANGFEVYALQALIDPVLLLLYLRWLDSAGTGGRPSFGAGAAFVLVLGVSFTNHMTTVLLVPGLVAYAGARLGWARLARAVPPLVPVLVAGLLPYALLPALSSHGPRFDWGGTHTLPGFIDHLTAREYRAWMFADVDTLVRQLRFVLDRVPRDLCVIGVLPVVLGIALLARRDRALATGVALVIGVTLAYACGYRIRELEPYLFGAALGLGLFAVAGLLAIDERWGSAAALIMGALLVAMSMVTHFHDCDESGNRLVEDLTRNQLDGLPQRAVLFTNQWDYALAASYYFQEVEGLRRDVVVVSPDLLRFGWYLDELERRAPTLVGAARAEAATFRAALRPFEHHADYDGASIDAAYHALLRSLVAQALRERPVLCTPEVSAILGGPWMRVPVGLAWELRTDSAYVAQAPAALRVHAWPGHMDGFIATTYGIYATALVQRSQYEREHGHSDLAARDLGLARSLDPHIRAVAGPPLPLDGQELVAQAAALFDGLEAAARR